MTEHDPATKAASVHCLRALTWAHLQLAFHHLYVNAQTACRLCEGCSDAISSSCRNGCCLAKIKARKLVLSTQKAGRLPYDAGLRLNIERNLQILGPQQLLIDTPYRMAISFCGANAL